MARPRPKVHLLHKQCPACGLGIDEVRLTTTQPHLVTCTPCRRTIHMADAEAKAANKRRRRKEAS